MKLSVRVFEERLVVPLGEWSLALFSYLGGCSLLLWETLAGFFSVRQRQWKLILDQLEKIGVDSLPLVFLTSLFTGMVLALQTAYQLQKISAELYIGSLVALSMTRELGPVLTALVIAGRVGAAITAELGTMRVTEQIDALQTLSTDPVRYLAVPRMLALATMLPLLTLYADLIGILGGYLVGVYKLGMGSALYMNMTWDALRYKDIFTGLFKSLVFAIVISTIACYEGFETSGGAEGVGHSTTLSVVISFILIIAADCFFTALFYFVFP